MSAARKRAPAPATPDLDASGCRRTETRPRTFAAAGEVIRCPDGMREVHRTRECPYEHRYYLWEPTVSRSTHAETQVSGGRLLGRADTRRPPGPLDFRAAVAWQMDQEKWALEVIEATCVELRVVDSKGRPEHYRSRGSAVLVGDPATMASIAEAQRAGRRRQERRGEGYA